MAESLIQKGTRAAEGIWSSDSEEEEITRLVKPFSTEELVRLFEQECKDDEAKSFAIFRAVTRHLTSTEEDYISKRRVNLKKLFEKRGEERRKLFKPNMRVSWIGKKGKVITGVVLKVKAKFLLCKPDNMEKGDRNWNVNPGSAKIIKSKPPQEKRSPSVVGGELPENIRECSAKHHSIVFHTKIVQSTSATPCRFENMHFHCQECDQQATM